MNNYHQDFPALMSDGRSFSNWQPTAVLNDQIRTREHLTTNWDYRQYLQKNANSIIAFDQTTACLQTGCPYAYVKTHPSFPSDLKDSFEKVRKRQTFDVNQLPINI